MNFDFEIPIQGLTVFSDNMVLPVKNSAAFDIQYLPYTDHSNKRMQGLKNYEQTFDTYTMPDVIIQSQPKYRSRVSSSTAVKLTILKSIMCCLMKERWHSFFLK